MKVILLQDIRNVGRKNEVKDVADGYARNLLLPRKLVEPATPEALKRLNAVLALKEKEHKESHGRLLDLKSSIEGRILEFHLKTDKHGTLFGSIGGDSILSALRDTKLITKERISVPLDRPIKELGEHIVPIHLGEGIEAKMRIRVQPQP